MFKSSQIKIFIKRLCILDDMKIYINKQREIIDSQWGCILMKTRRTKLTHALLKLPCGNGGLKFKFYIKKRWTKKSYERRDYEAIAGKQQFNATRTKLHPPLNQYDMG